MFCLMASVFARPAGRDDLAAHLRQRAEALRQHLGELGFAPVPDGRPARRAGRAPRHCARPARSPPASPSPHAGGLPRDVLLLYLSSPYRGWWALAGVSAAVYGSIPLYLVLALLIPDVVRVHSSTIVWAAGALRSPRWWSSWPA